MTPSIASYRDLIVWQRGLELVDEIDGILSSLSSFYRRSIGMQLYRAALSIVLNIAEGHDTDYTRVYLRSLADAKGSAREVEAGILIMRRRRYLAEAQTEPVFKLVDEVGRMLRSLSSGVRRSSAKR